MAVEIRNERERPTDSKVFHLFTPKLLNRSLAWWCLVADGIPLVQRYYLDLQKDCTVEPNLSSFPGSFPWLGKRPWERGWVEPRLTTTPWIRSRYYGHFILARKKAQSVIFLFKEPLNMATPSIRPDFCGPLLTGLTGFHCIFMLVIRKNRCTVFGA